jgi:hypothetical protein
MEKKLTSNIEEQLLRARTEGLREVADSSLRPLGKLWGMDVFTWHNPYHGMLSNTISAFPFPVIWIGNGADVVSTLLDDKLLCSNLHSVILTDASILELKSEWVSNIRNCAGTNSVIDAIEMLKVFKAPQKVLLFTSSGETALEQRREFEDYIKMVQGA